MIPRCKDAVMGATLEHDERDLRPMAAASPVLSSPLPTFPDVADAERVTPEMVRDALGEGSRTCSM